MFFNTQVVLQSSNINCVLYNGNANYNFIIIWLIHSIWKFCLQFQSLNHSLPQGRLKNSFFLQQCITRRWLLRPVGFLFMYTGWADRTFWMHVEREHGVLGYHVSYILFFIAHPLWVTCSVADIFLMLKMDKIF